MRHLPELTGLRGAAAAVFYLLIERPVLRLRDRARAPRTARPPTAAIRMPVPIPGATLDEPSIVRP